MTFLSDCDACMNATNQTIRQAMGCGYEPVPPPTLAINTWCHQAVRRPDPTKAYPIVCAGYTCKLPEVIEIARARKHWDKGQLETFCDGQPSELAVIAVEILDGQMNECEHWLMKPAADGGGGS